MAVYGRTGPFATSEQAFYIPHLRTKLPDGNRQLRTEEKEDKDYDKNRRSEQEIMMDYDGFDESDDTQSFEKEIANFKSTADRRMLETVYDLSPGDAKEVGDIAESMQEEAREELIKLESNILTELSEINEVQDEGAVGKIEDAIVVPPTNANAIIESIAKPIATGDWSKLPKKKNKPKPEDNPILKNWKERVTMAAETSESSSIRKILPPYPSDEHFAGIWRLTSSPGAPLMDEEELMEAITGDASSSENLILRIDGTTAGGPILDVENQHRAAGGTWDFFQAEWCGSSGGDNKDGAERPVQTRLRVRLLIPPSKDKVLVMEGEVKRGGIISVESISKANAKELLSTSSFGINKIAATAARESSAENDKDFVYVVGEAWVEDATGSGSRNRSKLGRFSLMKRKDRDPDQYQYSIPGPTRYQD